MKLDGRALFAPIVAALLLLVVLNTTMGAIRTAGLWSPAVRTLPAPDDNPYARIDRMLGRNNGGGTPWAARDPFGFGVTPTPGGPRHTTPRLTPVPIAPPMPILTSIVWDADPRATVRFDGRDYSVRPSSLFADFRVVSIARDQVVLDRGGETLVLRLPLKGD